MDHDSSSEGWSLEPITKKDNVWAFHLHICIELMIPCRFIYLSCSSMFFLFYFSNLYVLKVSTYFELHIVHPPSFPPYAPNSSKILK